MRLRDCLPLILIGLWTSHCSTSDEAARVSSRTGSTKCVKTTSLNLVGETIYTGAVQQVFQTKCVACHSPAGGRLPHLHTYDAAKSDINNAIAEIQNTSMPPRGAPQMANGDLALLQKWRDDGLLLVAPTAPPVDPNNPNPPVGPGTGQPTTPGTNNPGTSTSTQNGGNSVSSVGNGSADATSASSNCL